MLIKAIFQVRRWYEEGTEETWTWYWKYIV